MAEPVTLYPAKGGEPLVVAAPSEVVRLLATGQWLRIAPAETDKLEEAGAVTVTVAEQAYHAAQAAPYRPPGRPPKAKTP